MSNGVYVGSGETARKVAGMYIGVDGLARKVVKGYIGAGGLARLFYSAAQPFAYTYTGAYAESELSIGGVAYTMLTITGSGTLTVSRPIDADVWLCGGGGNGSGAGASNSGGGGGGGYIANTSVQLSGDVACVVGAAAGATSLGSTVANAGGNGSGCVCFRGLQQVIFIFRRFGHSFAAVFEQLFNQLLLFFCGRAPVVIENFNTGACSHVLDIVFNVPRLFP